MADPADHVAQVAEIVEGLRALGLEPVLVGGMALVVLGSRRVTRDFDFVIPHPGDRLHDVLAVFYDRGFELVSGLADDGEVVETIRNRRVASIRLRIDAPATAYFFNVKTGLRVDLLFDFPIPAATLLERATATTIRSHTFHIASEHDLLELKKLAHARRAAAGDVEDIAFLEARQKRSRPRSTS